MTLHPTFIDANAAEKLIRFNRGNKMYIYFYYYTDPRIVTFSSRIKMQAYTRQYNSRLRKYIL